MDGKHRYWEKSVGLCTSLAVCRCAKSFAGGRAPGGQGAGQAAGPRHHYVQHEERQRNLQWVGGEGGECIWQRCCRAAVQQPGALWTALFRSHPLALAASPLQALQARQLLEPDQHTACTPLTSPAQKTSQMMM